MGMRLNYYVITVTFDDHHFHRQELLTLLFLLSKFLLCMEHAQFISLDQLVVNIHCTAAA